MTDVKAWWQSKIIWAQVVAMIFMAGKLFGILPEGLSEQSVLDSVMIMVAVVTILFRIGTSTAITSGGK